MITIPTLVDSVKHYPDWEMTRLTYYSVACELPAAAWISGAKRNRIPFLTRGNAGVVYKPLGRNRLFRNQKQIQKLFDAIEGTEGIFLDLDDFWLPNSFFPQADRIEPVRGAVYRISLEVFRQASDFRLNRTTKERFLELMRKTSEGIQHSPEETAAFKDWSKSVIVRAQQLYPKSAELRLSWTETGGQS